MITLAHQKRSSSYASNPTATASSPAPSAATTAERRGCSRWARVRAALTAVVLCSLTALFIQQTEYAKRWKPALPLGLLDQSQAKTDSADREHHPHSQDVSDSSESKETLPEDTEFTASSYKDQKMSKKQFKSKSKIISAVDVSTGAHKKDSLKQPLRPGKEDTKEIPGDVVIENAQKKYQERNKPVSKSPTETIASREDSEKPRTLSRDGFKQGEESSFSSPLIVTEKDWPFRKHLVPIPLKTALGQTSSKETSSTRPITVAYIRNCKSDDPRCVEKKPMNFKKRCPYPGLVATEDWDSADIIVFSVWRIRTERFVPEIRRPPGQIWVMFSVEAPSRKTNHIQLDYEGIRGQFNLTMSYRLDADIPYPYGHLRRETVTKERDLEAVYSAKRFQVAWLVSHCTTNSKRETFVRLLQAAGLEVHIYGSCGNYSCKDGRRKRRSIPFIPDSVCMPHLSKNYFFYLSFENTMCKDYITEKAFKIYDAVDLIPVVLGGADYNKYLPPGTFVNVADFDSARELAKYLVLLASDKRRYLSMLREKNKWRRVDRAPWYCTLGEKLATGLIPKVLPDTRAWYTRDQCWRPHDIR